MCIFFFLIASKREKTPSKWQQNKRTCSVLVCQTPPTCHLIRNTRRDFRAKKNANYRRSDFLQVVQVDSPSGVDPEISERGGRKPNSRKGGGRNLTFQCRFPSFSYKSLTNIPPKGGGPGPSGPSPKSAPRLSLPPLRSGRSRLLRAFSAHPSASHSVTNT